VILRGHRGVGFIPCDRRPRAGEILLCAEPGSGKGTKLQNVNLGDKYAGSRIKAVPPDRVTDSLAVTVHILPHRLLHLHNCRGSETKYVGASARSMHDISSPTSEFTNWIFNNIIYVVVTDKHKYFLAQNLYRFLISSFTQSLPQSAFTNSLTQSRTLSLLAQLIYPHAQSVTKPVKKFLVHSFKSFSETVPQIIQHLLIPSFVKIMFHSTAYATIQRTIHLFAHTFI
jgi:hypothetical protein